MFSGSDSLFEYVNVAEGTGSEGGGGIDNGSRFAIKFGDKMVLVGSGAVTRRVRSSSLFFFGFAGS